MDQFPTSMSSQNILYLMQSMDIDAIWEQKSRSVLRRGSHSPCRCHETEHTSPFKIQGEEEVRELQRDYIVIRVEGLIRFLQKQI